MELFPKDPFQSQHAEIEHEHETEQGNHSRQRDIPRTDRDRYHDINEEDEEVEILPEHITNCRKDKNFQKSHGHSTKRREKEILSQTCVRRGQVASSFQCQNHNHA